MLGTARLALESSAISAFDESTGTGTGESLYLASAETGWHWLMLEVAGAEYLGLTSEMDYGQDQPGQDGIRDLGSECP